MVHSAITCTAEAFFPLRETQMTNLELKVPEMGWEFTGAWELVKTARVESTDKTVRRRREMTEVPGGCSNLRGSLEQLAPRIRSSQEVTSGLTDVQSQKQDPL